MDLGTKDLDQGSASVLEFYTLRNILYSYLYLTGTSASTCMANSLFSYHDVIRHTIVRYQIRNYQSKHLKRCMPKLMLANL